MRNFCLFILLTLGVSAFGAGTTTVNGTGTVTVSAVGSTTVPPQAATAQSFSDTYSGATANPMSTSASGGGTWGLHPGAMVNMQTVGGTVQGTAVHSGSIVLKDNTGTAWTTNDYTVTATGKNSGTSQQWGVMARMASPSSGNGYLLYLDNTTTATLYKVVDTGTLAFTAIGASFTITALNGTTDTIALGVSGSTMTIYRNGTSQGTRTDSTYTTGAPGIYDGNASGAAGQSGLYGVTSP